MNYKYVSYMASGEIMECNNFKTIYKSTRFYVRDDAQAAIICDNETKKPIAYMLYSFKLFKVFRYAEIHPNMKNFIETIFNKDAYGAYCLSCVKG